MVEQDRGDSLADIILEQPTPSERNAQSKAWFEMFPVDGIMEYVDLTQGSKSPMEDTPESTIVAADETKLWVQLRNVSPKDIPNHILKAQLDYMKAKSLKEQADSRRSDSEFKDYVLDGFSKEVAESQLTSYGMQAVIKRAEYIYDHGLRNSPFGNDFAQQLGFVNPESGGMHDPEEAQDIDGILYRQTRAEMLTLIARDGVPDISDFENPVLQMRESLAEWREEHIATFNGREP